MNSFQDAQAAISDALGDERYFEKLLGHNAELANEIDAHFDEIIEITRTYDVRFRDDVEQETAGDEAQPV